MIALVAMAAALACGAVPRPGVATLALDGAWQGAAVERCRRAATRLGRQMRFHGYRTMAELARAARDDVAFLAAADRTVTSTPVMFARNMSTSTQVLVANAPLASGGRPILCFIVGSAAEDALDDWLARTGREAIRLGFQEPDEMADGLASHKCAAMAVDAADRARTDSVLTTLAVLPIDAFTARPDPALTAALRD